MSKTTNASGSFNSFSYICFIFLLKNCLGKLYGYWYLYFSTLHVHIPLKILSSMLHNKTMRGCCQFSKIPQISMHTLNLIVKTYMTNHNCNITYLTIHTYVAGI